MTHTETDMCSKPKAPKAQPLPPARQLAQMPTTMLGGAGFGDDVGITAPRNTVAQNDSGQRIIGRAPTAGLGASTTGTGPMLPEMIQQAANRQAMRAPSAQSGPIESVNNQAVRAASPENAAASDAAKAAAAADKAVTPTATTAAKPKAPANSKVPVAGYYAGQPVDKFGNIIQKKGASGYNLYGDKTDAFGQNR